MSDERNARPVSGEIMAAGVHAGEAARANLISGDVIDAEFETLRPDPTDRLSTASAIPSIGSAAAPAQGLGSLRKGGDVASSRWGSTRGGPIFWIAGVGMIAGAFWISGGHALVRPASSDFPAQQLMSANPLKIAGVKSRVEDHDGRSILFVDGSAINEGSEELPLPPIALSVTGNGGGVMHYRLGTSSDALPPGGHFNFSTRLEAPKEGVKTISVAFSG